MKLSHLKKTIGSIRVHLAYDKFLFYSMPVKLREMNYGQFWQFWTKWVQSEWISRNVDLGSKSLSERTSVKVSKLKELVI